MPASHSSSPATVPIPVDGSDFLSRFDINKDGVLDKIEMRLMLEEGGSGVYDKSSSIGRAAVVSVGLDEVHLDPATNRVQRRRRRLANTIANANGDTSTTPSAGHHPFAAQYELLERLPYRYLFYIGPMAIALRFPGAAPSVYPAVIPPLEGLGNLSVGCCWTASCALVAAYTGFAAIRGNIPTSPPTAFNTNTSTTPQTTFASLSSTTTAVATVPASLVSSVSSSMTFHSAASLILPTISLLAFQRIVFKAFPNLLIKNTASIPSSVRGRAVTAACTGLVTVFPFIVDPSVSRAMEAMQ